MDRSWNIKCDSTFQQLTHATVSSLPQELRTQMEVNSSHCLYPQVAHGLRSKFDGGMQDPDYLRFPYTINHASGHADAENSFLALLSGPPSLLQCELQELSDPKSGTSSGNYSTASRNFVVDSVGTGTILTSSKGLMTEKLTNHKMQTKVDSFPAITSREMVGLSSGINNVFPDIQRADAYIQPALPVSENAREPHCSTRQRCGAIPLSNLNICSSYIQDMPNMALEESFSKMATPFMSGCPRVFCMGKSGYLLLSNTGLLGIVCSCHCCHMSVLKFCEHSGLHDVNPGDAVRMESGETIAEWQKLYFLKLGIRSPGNENEWDWPEVLSISTTVSLMKSNATNLNMSKSDSFHPFNPSVVSLRKPPDNVMFPKDAHTDYDGALTSKQQTIIHNGCNIPIRGSTGISPRNLHDRADSQFMEFNATPPNLVGTQWDDGSLLTPAYLDTLKRSGNFSVANFPSQNPTSFLKDLGFCVKKSANEGSVGRDATSSNFELRLGQPPQTRNPVLSIIEQQQFDSLVSPPKLQYSMQITQNSAESLGREDELKNNFCYAAGPSNSKMIEEQSKLKLRNFMSGVNNGLSAARAGLETDNVAKGFVSSYSLFNSQSQGQGKTKANENLENDGSVIMSKILHSGSNNLQSNVLWKSDDHRERQLNNSSLVNNKVLDNDKGAACAKEFYANVDPGSRMGKLVGLPSFVRAVGGSSSCCISSLNGKISCHEPSMLVDASTGTNFSYGSNKASSVGQGSHLTVKSLGTQLASRMPAEGMLIGFPFLVSSSTSNQAPTFLEQEGINVDTCLLDENMRLLALTQILELSRQQHTLYLREMNQTQGRSCSFPNGQHCIHEASTSKQGNSDVTLKSPPKKGTCVNHGITDDLEKLASFTGKQPQISFPSPTCNSLNRYCCLSTLEPRPLHSKEKELQCKHSSDLRKEGPSLSLGTSKGITRSCECELSCEWSEQPTDTHLVDKYTCSAQVNCPGNFMLGVGPSPYNIRQQPAKSNFTIDQNASQDKNNQFVQVAGFDDQDLNKLSSNIIEWRAVPSKVRKGVCDVGSLDQPAIVLDCWQGGEQLGNIPAKRLKRTAYLEDSLKEQESSSVSSGCSAPVVTQLSVEVNNVYSSTVDAVDNHSFDNLVVDEGSSIDKGCSSDTLESDRSAEILGSTCDTYLKKAYERVSNDQPCRSLLDELKLLNSLTWKKGRGQNYAEHSENCKTKQSLKVRRGFKGIKQKRKEISMLDAMFPSEIPSSLHNKNAESSEAVDFPSNLSKEIQMYFASDQQRSKNRASFVQPSATGKAAFSSKFLSCKSHLRKHYSDRDGQNSYKTRSDFEAEFHKFTKVSGTRKLRKDFTSESFRHFQKEEPVCEESENDMKTFYSRQVNAFRKTRPVVYGRYGEICSGIVSREVPKPAKIVSLSKVLKTSQKCKVAAYDKFRLTTKKKWKKLSTGTINGYSGLKTKDNSGNPNAVVCDETNVDISKEDLRKSNKPFVICKVKRDVKTKQGGSIIDRIHAPSKLKGKETWKRSIYELTAKDSAHDRDALFDHMLHENIYEFSLTKVLKCLPETREKKILEVAQDREHDLCNTNSKRSVQEHRSASNMDSDAFCCVCRSSSSDEINYLLECSRCQIRACVLCGYGGGAMTRALRTHTIAKSLLKVWNIKKEGMPKHTIPKERFEKEMGAFHSTKSVLEGDQNCVSRPENIETSTTDILEVEILTEHMQHKAYSNGNFNVQNSIIAGVFDTTVKQWVHMVCGLWTPGTRCPNVDTMSAFDVSGVSYPKADMACSICNRWGGSCIECRVVGCSIQFHPWCAHQKNLLQSEAEGVDGDKVGFYGRCAHHANDLICQVKHDLIGNEMGCLEKLESTCARTEGYKGRRRDGFQHNYFGVIGKGGCLVPQEQLNAWIHINGQKLCSQGHPKFPVSDVEYDCRKEYGRYKQAKGWKHLVVYKSGIHALGLYTSRFISQGEMVVEYVGEIVGQRVADKRETEYQSGRKLQYKSACYFFRIDKEHIIDATRKGGIARFVNHSCLPNCVAKVINVRHEKKVVFFAERDIFPGEEITYDYHFNHEDEGQKIPCYCNSKNCRRYLN
ncbi:Histone-lysine N-methyltransferase TRX1 [Senna tora]|uniref:Histone-lysine N-methyltransferase TRX1 n=1 Tax=Senna tora TaxID=362788 RepID=A0A834WDR5_9FABA|nr:Histone-lysine N-methyltransferase TRX1 [Senna tora]